MPYQFSEAHTGINRFRKYISNIDAVDNRNTEWRESLVDVMQNYGFYQIGSGKYGAVFDNPRYRYVVKVFMKDTAYLRWLNFCKDHQHNPYIPKIRGKVVKISNIIMAVRLEKLNVLPESNGLRILLDYCDNPYRGMMETNDPDLQEILHYFIQNVKLLDMHSGNILGRGRQPVIIDPFYNWYNDGFTIDPNDIENFKHIF